MTRWKGLVLAGGTGSRLHPLTGLVNKHLLPVYDKPMIFYPLTTLMFAGITEFVLVTTPEALSAFRALLGDGARWGLSITYRAQERPGGIAEGFRIARDDLEGCSTALILGDNIFYGTGLGQMLRGAVADNAGATIFSYEVADPAAFGIVELDENRRPILIEEKPANPRSNLAVTGLYLYDERVLGIADDLTPSGRGELEITDVNRAYLAAGNLAVRPFGRGVAWLDGGTTRDLFEASQFVKVLEERTGLKIACPEEIALRLGLIDRAQFAGLLADMPSCDYRDYLAKLKV